MIQFNQAFTQAVVHFGVRHLLYMHFAVLCKKNAGIHEYINKYKYTCFELWLLYKTCSHYLKWLAINMFVLKTIYEVLSAFEFCIWSYSVHTIAVVQAV